MSATETFLAMRSAARPGADTRSREVAALVEREAGSLLDYFRRRTATPDDAADLLGETLLVVWRRERSIPDDPTRARMWMFGVARRVLAGQRRTVRRRGALTERLGAELALHPVEVDDPATSRLRELIEQLGTVDREIVKLVYWDGFSLVEVAQLLGMPAATVRSRHHRARARLRDALSVVE